MRLFKFFFLTILSLLLLNGCENTENDKVYDFIGDSLIARWPLDETFPSQLVYNYGKSGAGIDYIKENINRFNGKDVVVMIGTNDNKYFSQDYVQTYVDEYLETITRLTDKTIYLFSVLPRKFTHDSENINTRITSFNSLVIKKLQSYPNIVYIDVFNDFMDKGHINYQYYSDGLHLNIYGYEVLSKHLLKVIK